MRRVVVSLAVLAATLWLGVSPAAEVPMKRVLWTTSKIAGSPDPKAPYQPENAFPKLRFDQPLELTAVPDSNQLAVAERFGKLFLFENDAATSEKHLLLDVERTVYGLAFHPQFKANGRFYVTSITEPMAAPPKGTRVSEFKAEKDSNGRLSAKLSSERTIIEWPSGGHNGGCLKFGIDGKLYIATGDGSGIADELQTGQDLSDLFGSILRLDVDRYSNAVSYTVPDDNPFVGMKDARPEIWSYGHRQIWKFNFDFATGRLWAGEVGQDLWEMIYLIKRGGNYGWSVQEGSHPFRPARKLGPTPIQKPIVEHPHVDFRSITGGVVNRSDRLPELKGAYIYGDFDTGKIWSFKYTGGAVTEHRELCDTQLRVIAIAQDRAFETLILDFAGSIYRLKNAPPADPNAPPFPKLLSQTGLFSSTHEHVAAPGVLSYEVNSPLWSDGAHKDRFIALPGDSQIEFDAVTYPEKAAPPGWRFPNDAVLVKTFSLELEPGNPKSRKRLETRILHRELMPGNDDEYGAQDWHGYTYVWNDAQTDAELLDAKGLDREYEIRDAAAPGGKRTQTWHFPSRAECTLCHTMAARYVLGATTLQMNRAHDYGSFAGNQLEVMSRMGYFKQPLPQTAAELPKLVEPSDAKADLNARARSYLHANCSHCHRMWGGGNAEFSLLANKTLKETGTIDVKPGQGAFGLSDPRYIVPGDPSRSMIHFRMTKTSLGRMPHVGSNVVDKDAATLIEQWIRSLK